jgi:hypothetical protein
VRKENQLDVKMTGVKISPIVSPRIFTKTNVDLKVAASSPTNKGKSDKS